MLWMLSLSLACQRAPSPVPGPEPVPPSAPREPDALVAHCQKVAPEPTVTQVAPQVWLARGYDLANTIVIATPKGNVVVDPGMSPQRARTVREAVERRAPGPTKAIVYTHSHINHIGGASAWADPGTEVWAADGFTAAFFSQYGMLLPAETARGARQFGVDVVDRALGCSGLGPRPDLVAALENGTLLPTRTVSGQAELDLGGVHLQLLAMPGETQDQLAVWLPETGVLLPGDDFAAAWPSLYTLRGTNGQPAEPWLASLDAMRRLDPVVLIPSHTAAIVGREQVRSALTRYRDGIQWVRDAVVRGANRGTSIDDLANQVKLPPRLAQDPDLVELSGQVDWTVRALYQDELGWFDGQPEELYPLSPADAARRTVEMMGGTAAVVAAARRARTGGQAAWALHLLRLVEQAGGDVAIASVGADGTLRTGPDLNEEVARTLEAQAASVANPNGRAWLLQSAWDRRHGMHPAGQPHLSEDFIDQIPIPMIFQVMATRLRPADAMGIDESVVFHLSNPDRPDDDDDYVVTVRDGIAEVVVGAPLPGTPEPLAEVTTTPSTWRRVALGLVTPVSAVASRQIQLDGDPMALLHFLDRFDQGLFPRP